MSIYFLGLDCSTQSLTGIITDSTSIIYERSINFDKNLPQYNTTNGVIILDDEKVVHSSPLMWVEALELLLYNIQNHISIKNIKAISGSGQQHGTVYLNNKFELALQALNPKKPIINKLKGSFSRETSPIWMDSSTSIQCEEIRNTLGGLKETIKITGSNTFERFSGPQIRKFYQENLERYRQTSIIHLVSSFMATILLGQNAPIDYGDGAGMNLMNIKTKQWDKKALDATAPNLIQKLPPLTDSSNIIGKISPYFIKKYGFDPNTLLVAWSGDNPNSLIGVGLIDKGKAAISLGTSDTYFGYMESLSYDLGGESHVFGAPTGDYMSLICYKNGSLAREKIKQKFNLDWVKFSEILKNTPPGNYGKIMLPYFFPEIVPLVLTPKVYRFGFDDRDLDGNVRAIIEAQFLSMRLHSEWIGEMPEEIYATGRASENREILEIIANIFNTRVVRFEISDSATLGAAIRSAKTYYDSINVKKSWQDIVDTYLNMQKREIIEPDKKYKSLYDELLIVYKKYEDYVLRNGEDPEPFRNKFIQRFFQS